MSTQHAMDTVIVGLGKTGLSVARYLEAKGREFAVVDSRKNPPNAGDLARDFFNVPHQFGSFESIWFESAKQLVVNPGIAVKTAILQQAKQAGAELVGDIELFAREIKQSKPVKPVIAITGSNGKTTVTHLLDLMAKKSGMKVATGGNIGTPALDLLNQDANLFVLELSSYQLETTSSLHTVAAVILNISEDHLDRYDNDIEKYAQSKAVIYKHCKHVICNRDDAYSMRFAKQAAGDHGLTTFGMSGPGANQFGIRRIQGEAWLAKGNDLLMPITQIKLPGSHNVCNALAALALGETVGLKMSAMLDVLREYVGMPHRTQWIRELNGVNWYNDSKGTNVGATLAALSGLAGKTVLIAGGQGKSADFSPLKKAVADKARAVILIGEDAPLIASIIDDSNGISVPVAFADSLSDAIDCAQKYAQSGDNVLLSPACASFDMFENYEARGQVFMDAVKRLKEQDHV